MGNLRMNFKGKSILFELRTKKTGRLRDGSLYEATQKTVFSEAVKIPSVRRDTLRTVVTILEGKGKDRLPHFLPGVKKAGKIIFKQQH